MRQYEVGRIAAVLLTVSVDDIFQCLFERNWFFDWSRLTWIVIHISVPNEGRFRPVYFLAT